MTRARTNVDDIEASIHAAIMKFRPVCAPMDEPAWAEIETFVAISLRVMKKTNPSKLRDCARTEEIKARLSGREVIEDDE